MLRKMGFPLQLPSPGSLRHMALNVMQKDKSKSSLLGKFMRAGWDDRHMVQLLALF